MHNIFLERPGEARISTDRLDEAPVTQAIQIAQGVGMSRDKPFYGWASVIAKSACQSGRRVEATPRLDNPCHADIVLPDAAIEDREEQKRHALELANAAQWLDRETVASENE